MKRSSKKRAPPRHELRGTCLLLFSGFLALSLLTYIDQMPSCNLLGYLGYSVAFCFLYLFGIGSYFLLVALGYAGYQYLKTGRAYTEKSYACLGGLLLSTGFLATIAADMLSPLPSLITSKIYCVVPAEGRGLPRYYLGGAPSYYFYKDLPVMNLEEFLRPSGALLIFSALFALCLMLLTQTSIGEVMRFFSFCIRKIFSCCRRAFWGESKRSHRLRKEPRRTKVLRASLFQKKEKKSNNQTCSLPLPKKEVAKRSLRRLRSYEIPASHLLTLPPFVDPSSLKRGLAKQARILEKTLQNFQIEARVGEIHCGPTITLFEVEPPVGVKVQKIQALEKDIALSMEAKSIRILAPIPGKAVVGIEVPSSMPQEVSFREMLEYYQRQKRKYYIPVLLGKTVTGEYVSADLTKMPHCLIAGATGSGKSVCINTIVMSILMNASPEVVRLLMIDPKKVELSQYSQLPHMIAPVISEPHGAHAALQWLVKEMQRRYDILKQLKLRNIHAFNKRPQARQFEETLPIPVPETMPFIVGIIDEFADLMMVSGADLETPIARIAQMARAVGIHLIIATQRPSREVITGIIKANFPTRIALKVSNRVNSQIILDDTGADSLLGNGDLLFTGTAQLIRAQGAYVSDQDIYRVIESIAEQAPPRYLIESFDAMKQEEAGKKGGGDALYEKALEVVLTSRSASTTFLQRKLKIGYARAASLMDELEEQGIVGPQEGAKPRKVLRSGAELSS
ncbi:MAG: DNA translocase FtsK 4TM domain-containing protein [Chlamydiota bacterium]